MDKIARISVDIEDKNEITDIANFIKVYCQEINVREGYITFKINESQPIYKDLINLFNERKYRFTFYETRNYSKKELEEAQFYSVDIFPYPWEYEPEKDAAYYGTKYSSDKGCNECKRGLNQISPLVIDINKIKKYRICNIIPEIIISKETKENFLENNFSGIRFGSILDYKNRDSQNYFQLFITNSLPPISCRNHIVVDNMSQCSSCGKGGLFIKSEFIYSKDDFVDVSDFNLTDEWFWTGNYCRQMIIVSKKVYEWFKKQKVRILLEPIHFQ